MNKDVIRHYDMLIEENNDPVYDPNPLQEYMKKWDGQIFIDELLLTPEKSVLEIGVGTGRLALQVAPFCKRLTALDISPKTLERAKKNLSKHRNIEFICSGFMEYTFSQKFDVIYLSLVFMHIAEKQAAVWKISRLLTEIGRLVISIDKNQSEFIDMGSRKIRIYPDHPSDISEYMKNAGLFPEKIIETEFAYILTAAKRENLSKR